jgi:hypothetical protein
MMLVRFGKFLVIVALVATTGFHWALLQTAAWTAMLADHLHTQSFSEAVTQTFDGRHPCKLCLAIAAAKKAGKKSEAVAANFKMEFPPLTENFVLIAPPFRSNFAPVYPAAGLGSHRPPVPPPRAAVV